MPLVYYAFTLLISDWIFVSMDGTDIVLLHVLHVISSQSDVVPRNCMYLKILDIENRMRQKKNQFVHNSFDHQTFTIQQHR